MFLPSDLMEPVSGQAFKAIRRTGERGIRYVADTRADRDDHSA
jgi:hypothetical protein